MPVWTQKELQLAIKSGNLGGAYLFIGEEDYLKSAAANRIRKTLFPDPSLLSLGRDKLSGESSTFAEWFSDLRAALSSLGMFGSERLVELHAVSYGKLSDRELDELLALLLEPLEDVTLLLYALPGEFDPGTLPKRPSKLYKKFAELPNLKIISFDRETPARLTSWVQKHFAASGIFCPPPVARALIDHCSTDMFLLAGEVEKLSCYLLSKGIQEASEETMRYVCRSSSIQGSFDFTNAILSGNTAEAMRLLSAMKRRKERPELILAGISETVGGMFNCRVLQDSGKGKAEIATATGLHEYRVGLFLQSASRYKPSALKAALDACTDTDLKLKSSAYDKYLLLELLVLRLGGRSA